MTAPRPFASEQEARRAAHQVIAPEGGSSILSFAQNRDLIRRALSAAGVETSPYEDRTLRWLGGWEDTTASVIARWIAAAAEAGKPGPRTITIDLSAPGAYHVLTEALERYADLQRDLAENEGGNDAREGWAGTADRLRGQVEDAANRPQGTADEGGTGS